MSDLENSAKSNVLSTDEYNQEATNLLSHSDVESSLSQSKYVQHPPPHFLPFYKGILE